MQPDNVEGDLAHVLLTEEQISDRIAAIAAEIDEAYQGRDLLLVGVLNGAVMVMADLVRVHCGPTKSRWTGWPFPPMAREPPRVVWCEFSRTSTPTLKVAT